MTRPPRRPASVAALLVAGFGGGRPRSNRSAALRAALVAAVLCAFLGGCGGGNNTPSASTPTPTPATPAATPAAAGDLVQLERLMERRAAALAAGRPRAYAATATGPQRDRDREAARNARGLGLRDVELAVDSTDVSGRSATLRVQALYGVRGVRGRFGTARRITRAAHGGRLARRARVEPARAPPVGDRAACRRGARSTSSCSHPVGSSSGR